MFKKWKNHLRSQFSVVLLYMYLPYICIISSDREKVWLLFDILFVSVASGDIILLPMQPPTTGILK